MSGQVFVPFCLYIGVDAARFPHIQIDESTQYFNLTKTETAIGSGESPQHAWHEHPIPLPTKRSFLFLLPLE